MFGLGMEDNFGNFNGRSSYYGKHEGSAVLAAVLAVCCVRCGPCRLLCLGGGGGVSCGGNHVVICNVPLPLTLTVRTTPDSCEFFLFFIFFC